MLPREYLRENAARLAAEMPERFGGAGLEEYAALERERRECVTQLEEKRRRRNALSAEAEAAAASRRPRRSRR